MSTYARGWMFGALCSMSALGGGWAVAATLAREDASMAAQDARPLPQRGVEPTDRSTPPMSEHLYFTEHKRLIAC